MLVDLCTPVLVLQLSVRLCVSVCAGSLCLFVAVVVVVDVSCESGQWQSLTCSCLSVEFLSIILISFNSPDSVNFTDDLLNYYSAKAPYQCLINKDEDEVSLHDKKTDLSEKALNLCFLRP